ncbi:glutamine synthetase family protein [Longispora albida]|uniref:glutamine synthetase family protein n=1 Tax=Longispora albida TaxID=203523 RepID=UPI000360A5DC|nr:glutamine synthetase family protein [Longispora albida]
MELSELRAGVASGAIDTVVVAITDMQGRLQGKRFHAPFFLDTVLGHGAESCDYLLAVDVEMNTVDGYALSSWDSGYGDLAMRPDLGTLRPLPWLPGSVLVLADLEHPDGHPVEVSPRRILQRQLGLLREAGYTAKAGTELEFVLYRDSYPEAREAGYQGLRPATGYNVDYSILGTSPAEPLLRRIRTQMAAAGLSPESAKGECNLGQYEIAFRFDEALTTADQHVLYKTGSKEIAAQEGMSLTFMAKPNQREGNSCHIHFSLWAEEEAVTERLLPRITAGLLATMRDFALLYAPNINSYKRYQPGSFAPTALRWGRDNRTCALRVVGHDVSLRVENRVPGADVNPYLALAGMVAGALHGLLGAAPEQEEFAGNAYGSDSPVVPPTLRDALALWESSPLVKEAFGAEVAAHYANMARVELAAFDAAVTDWELVRGFERL